jgi:putative endonuclease
VAISQSAARLGEAGENFVASHLIRSGCTILARNWRVREGELDIIAQDITGTVLIVEVKTRTSVAFGDPLESINPSKLMRVQRLALAWLATHELLGNPYRIDVAGVLISRSGEMTLDYRKEII